MTAIRASVRLCLAETLMSLWLYAEHPQPALPEGEADAWRRYRDRTTVRGPWSAFEARILAELVSLAWRMDDRTCGFWPALTDDPGILDWEGPEEGSGWARIRVTVEVLDGLP